MSKIRSTDNEFRSGSSEPYSILSCFRRSNATLIRRLISRQYSISS